MLVNSYLMSSVLFYDKRLYAVVYMFDCTCKSSYRPSSVEISEVTGLESLVLLLICRKSLLNI